MKLELSDSLCNCVIDASSMRTHTMEMIRQFYKLKPPKFEGGIDPMVYGEWLWRMENLFEIIECPERFKVHLAAYQFEKEAEFRWETVKPRVGEPVLT